MFAFVCFRKHNQTYTDIFGCRHLDVVVTCGSSLERFANVWHSLERSNCVPTKMLEDVRTVLMILNDVRRSATDL